MAKIAPAVLLIDYFNPEKSFAPIKNEIEVLHFDVMDRHFVPNLTYGAPLIKSFRDHFSEVIFDVHLMVANPDSMIDDFVNAGANTISVHFEACPHLHRTLEYIRSKNCKAGIAINPATGLHQVSSALLNCDQVILMGVNPGFGGQKFIESTKLKVQEFHQHRKVNGLQYSIMVDGGVGVSNIKTLHDLGADLFVGGSSLFQGDVKKNWNDLQCKLTS